MKHTEMNRPSVVTGAKRSLKRLFQRSGLIVNHVAAATIVNQLDVRSQPSLSHEIARPVIGKRDNAEIEGTEERVA